MNRAEETEFFWIVSSAGTWHVARKNYPTKPKFIGKYVSLCCNVTKEDQGLEDPMCFEELDDVPEGREICGHCRKLFIEKYRDVSVSIHLDKGVAIDLKEFLDGEDFSEERIEEMRSELEKRLD